MITIQISMVEYYDPFKEWMESYRNGKVNKKQEEVCLYAVGE